MLKTAPPSLLAHSLYTSVKSSRITPPKGFGFPTNGVESKRAGFNVLYVSTWDVKTSQNYRAALCWFSQRLRRHLRSPSVVGIRPRPLRALEDSALRGRLSAASGFGAATGAPAERQATDANGGCGCVRSRGGPEPGRRTGQACEPAGARPGTAGRARPEGRGRCSPRARRRVGRAGVG